MATNSGAGRDGPDMVSRTELLSRIRRQGVTIRVLQRQVEELHAAKVQTDILRTTLEDERRRSSAFIRGLGADHGRGLTAWLDGLLEAVEAVEQAVCELEPDGRRTRPVRRALDELRGKIGRF